MADHHDIILEYLRRIDSRLVNVGNEIQDIKHRLSVLEHGYANHTGGLAHIQARLDRVDERISRIERRLEISDIPELPGAPETAPPTQ